MDQSVSPPAVGRSTLTLLALTFGLNHAAVTTPILYQSAYLGSTLGNYDNAILYIVTMFMALFGASALNDVLGPRVSLTLSMCGYAAYVLLFAAALITDGSSRWCFAIGGSILGGLAAGLLWTAQGAIFTRICENVAAEERKEKEDVTAELAGTFGFLFLGWEAFLRALYTGILALGEGSADDGSASATNTTVPNVTVESPTSGGTGPPVSPATIFFAYGFAALLAACIFFVRSPPDASTGEAKGPMCAKATKALELWKDPKLWLLQLTNLTFGFAAAWNASYIGPNFVAKALSPDLIGFTGAITSLIGGLGAKVLGMLAERIGKYPVVLIGAVCFFFIGLLSAVLPDGESLGGCVFVFPLLMGIGRAVYETTNKAIFADFYPGAQSAGAFANVMVFGTMSSSLVFCLNSVDLFSIVIYMLIAGAVVTYPALLLADMLQPEEESDESSYDDGDAEGLGEESDES